MLPSGQEPFVTGGEGELFEGNEPEPVEPEKVDSDKEVWIVPIGFKGMIGEEISEVDSVVTTDSLNIVLDSAVATDTPEGFMMFEQIVLAKEIVQDYDGKKVYKPADELRKILDHGENRPITDEHPVKGIVTSITERKGFIKNLTFTDTNELRSDMIITCPVLIDAIKSGKQREVSIGFYSDIDRTPGVFNDTHYTEVQKNILLDHVASTEKGRCSRQNGCGIHKMDSVPKTESAPQTPTLTQAQKDSLKQANDIIQRQRVDMIAQLSAISPDVSRETFDSMSHDELKRMHTVLKFNIPDSSGAGINIDSKKETDSTKIDQAYDRIGTTEE